MTLTVVQVAALLSAMAALVGGIEWLVIGPRRHRQSSEANTSKVLAEAAAALVQPLQKQLDESRQEAERARAELRAFRHEVDSLRVQIDQVRTQLWNETAMVTVLVEGIRQLIDQLVGLGVKPVWTLPDRFNRRRPAFDEGADE